MSDLKQILEEDKQACECTHCGNVHTYGSRQFAYELPVAPVTKCPNCGYTSYRAAKVEINSEVIAYYPLKDGQIIEEGDVCATMGFPKSVRVGDKYRAEAHHYPVMRPIDISNLFKK